MRASLLDEYNTVVNVVMHDGDWAPPDGLRIGPEGGEVGHVWDGDRYITPPELAAADPLPQDIQQPAYVADPLHTEALLSLQNQIDDLRSRPTYDVIPQSDAPNASADVVSILEEKLRYEVDARLVLEQKLDGLTTALANFANKQEGVA